MWVRDRLDGLWRDEDFADWYPRDGRPGLSPAQLATVCVLQFVRCAGGEQTVAAGATYWIRGPSPRGRGAAGVLEDRAGDKSRAC